MIRRYQHVGISVTNLDRSVAWYQEMLGFELMGSAEASGPEVSQALAVDNSRLKLATLARGDCVLELIEYVSPQGARRAPRPPDVGCTHMALDVDNIQAMYREMSAKGVKFNTVPQRNPPDIAWAWWVYLQDPDGVPIELVQVAE